ncbi:MAG: hypothetical protein ACYC1M_11735 [Armatimonadota bacterium]
MARIKQTQSQQDHKRTRYGWMMFGVILLFIGIWWVAWGQFQGKSVPAIQYHYTDQEHTK